MYFRFISFDYLITLDEVLSDIIIAMFYREPTPLNCKLVSTCDDRTLNSQIEISKREPFTNSLLSRKHLKVKSLNKSVFYRKFSILSIDVEKHVLNFICFLETKHEMHNENFMKENYFHFPLTSPSSSGEKGSVFICTTINHQAYVGSGRRECSSFNAIQSSCI